MRSRKIIENAVSAGTRGPRFHPVTRDELEKLEYSVDILGEPEEQGVTLERFQVIRHGGKS